MKLLLLGSLLFSGGGAVALQNENVSNTVSETYNTVKTMVQAKFQGSMIDRVRESGFPYPNENVLSQLTDEQEAILVSTIDQINAEYDWQNMTDAEIIAALQDVRAELDQVKADLGIDPALFQEQNQVRQGKHWNDSFVPGSGNGQQSRGAGAGTGTGDCPYGDSVTDDTTTDSTTDAA